MKDLLLIALFAGLGATGAGLLGWVAVRLLRRRSVALSLFCVAVVTVLAVTSGTFAVAQAMFLSGHDLGVVITVLGMASVVSLLTAALLGRQVVAGSRALTRPPAPSEATPASPHRSTRSGSNWPSSARNSPPPAPGWPSHGPGRRRWTPRGAS